MSPDSLMETVGGRSMKQEALDAVKRIENPRPSGRGARQNRHSSSTGFTHIDGDFAQTAMTPDVDKRAHLITDQILTSYGKLHLQQLNDLTRSEDPYRLNAPSKSSIAKNAIPPETIRAYYLAKWATPQPQESQTA